MTINTNNDEMSFIENLKLRANESSWNMTKNGYYYDSPEDFVINEGAHFKSQKMSKEEIDLFNEIFKKSKSNKDKECFYNSQLMTLMDTSDSIEYWEGYTNSFGRPIMHGFNVLNGKVIDVTHKVKDNPILGEYIDKEYIGVQFPKSMILERLRNGKNSVSFIDDYVDEWPVLKTKWNAIK